MYRRTGKTFRVLCQAMLTCSNGQSVVIVCDSDEAVKSAFQRLVVMTHYDLLDYKTPIKQVVFPNGFIISIMSVEECANDERLIGVKRENILRDYHI